jgi:hypothetical protein
MQQRLGLLNSHPLITDEITAKNRAAPEWLPEFLLDMTEGRGKERMESGSNKERLNLSTWMTTCLMSSNTHVVDYLTGGRDHSSEGELRRLLEFVLEDELSWEPHEIEIIKSLQACLKEAGGDLSNIVKVTFYLTDIRHKAVIWEARKEFFASSRPASTLVEVTHLVDPLALLEVDAVAYMGK